MEELNRDAFPEPTDRLFVADDDWEYESTPGLTSDEWWLLAGGYDEAADRVAAVVLSETASHSQLIYPLVFLYRHAIEVRLKDILNLADRCMLQPAETHDTHDLKTLWKLVRPIAEDDQFALEPTTIDALGCLIGEFSAWDPGSFSFRYPTDRKGRPVEFVDDRFSIRNFVRISRRVLNALGRVGYRLGQVLYGEPHDFDREYGEGEY